LEVPPRQLRGIALAGDRDVAAADIHPTVAGLDLAGEGSVPAVVLQEMRVRMDGAEVVDGDALDVLAPALVQRAQHQPPDAAAPVDRNPRSHQLLRTYCSTKKRFSAEVAEDARGTPWFSVPLRPPRILCALSAKASLL